MGHQINDMLISTLDDLGRPDLQDISSDLSYLEFAGRLLRRERMSIESGKGIKRTLMHKMSELATFIDRYTDEDSVAFENVLAQLSAEWCTVQVPWMMEEREPLMNRGKSLVTNVIKPRRLSAMNGLADKLEDKVWTVRLPGSDKFPNGFPYWIVKNAIQGFNGGYPGTHTDIAGINLTTVPNFKNWTDTWSNVTGPDLIRKMSKAHRRTRWHSPFGQPTQIVKTNQNRFRIYMNDDTADLFENYVDGTNQNLGSNIAFNDVPSGGSSRRGVFRENGEIVFKRHPIVPLEILDTDTDNPVYMTDFNTVQVVVLAGDYLRESGPHNDFKRHFWKVWWMSLTFQIIIVDRRRHAVLYQV